MAWMVPIVADSSQLQQDDKLLAELIGQDKEGKYEFKILRGYPGAFRNAERLRAVLEEERRSRWDMVVKLDDERLVLRRPRSASAYDVRMDPEIDPYRTRIGGSRTTLRRQVVVLVGLLVAAAGVGALVYARQGEIRLEGSIWSAVVAIGLVAVVVVLALLKASRR